MPIHNIVDKRTNHYDIHVKAVIEGSWHDNSIHNATQFEETNDNVIVYVKKTTIDHMIRYAAQEWPNLPVTLFLYDPLPEDYYDYETIIDDAGRLCPIPKKIN